MFPIIHFAGTYWLTYYVMMLLGSVVATAVALIIAPKMEIRRDIALRTWVIIIICVIIGSKILYCFTDGITRLNEYMTLGNEIRFGGAMVLLFGGFRFFGGLSLALFGGWLHGKIAHLDFFKYAPIVTIPAPLWFAIARIGCYSEGCCGGIETNSSLGVHFPTHAEGIYVLPLQLFECGAYFILFIIQLVLWRKHKTGNVHIHFLIGGFAVVRFLAEYIRADANWVLPFISVTQIICIGVIPVDIIIERWWRSQDGLSYDSTALRSRREGSYEG